MDDCSALPARAWVAIKHVDEGYTVAIEGDILALAAEKGGDHAIYDFDLLIDFDYSAWNSELGYWEGTDRTLAGDLASPVFVTLQHE